MAEIKWIKITTELFDDEKIRVIEKMPEGDTMLVIWLKLLVLAGKKNDHGFVYLTDNIPYTPDILSDIFNRESRMISLALNTFASFGMIEIENDIISVLNWDKHQNVEGMDKIRLQNRERQANYRARKQIESNVTSRDGNGTDKDKEEDKDKDKIKDIIAYLNSVTSSNYRAKSTNTKKHIKARIAEGYSYDEFTIVIDKKYREWNGTDMERYLCPDTLFGSKFEKYLNQKIVNSKPVEQETTEEELDAIWK